MNEQIEKIKADLAFAIKPIWLLPKQEQAELLETFINDLIHIFCTINIAEKYFLFLIGMYFQD